MSLSNFSAQIKNYIRLRDVPPELIKQFRLLQSNYKESFNSQTDEIAEKTFKDLSSVLEKDKPSSNPKYPATSYFRTRGMLAANTRLGITENDLAEKFVRYGLTKPDNFKTLIEFYYTWLRKYSTRFGTKGRAGKKSFKNNVEVYKYVEEDLNTMNGDESIAEEPVTIGQMYAVRIKNIPHTATADVQWEFLKFRAEEENKTFVSRRQFSEDYEIGHIEAQSHGRHRISSQTIPLTSSDIASANPEDLIQLLTSFIYYSDLASSSLLPQYSKYQAAITKDFNHSSKNIYMNVELQATGEGILIPGDYANPFTNQGSAALSRALGILQALKGSVYDDKKSIDKQILSLKKIKSNMLKLYQAYQQNKEYILITFENFKNMPPNFLLNLESSDSLITFTKNKVLSPFNGQKNNIKVNHNNVLIKTIDNSKSKQLKNNINQSIKNLGNDLKTLSNNIKKSKKGIHQTLRAGRPSQLRTKTGQFYGLAPLQRLLDASLVQRVKDNMGTGNRRDILNLRTGRFAESVKVERLSQSREGMITAFYNYMKNPYATFSQGGRQEFPKTRDPKLLIAKSIREIGATMVANRMRAVLV